MAPANKRNNNDNDNNQPPDDNREEYSTNDEYIDLKEFVYFEITKAIYVLAQSGRLTRVHLKQHLAQYSYHPTKRIHGLKKHKSRKTSFIYDNFQLYYFPRRMLIIYLIH